MTTASFSLYCYNSMLSSDVFYPSKCKKRMVEDKGSLRDSLKLENIDIFDREEVKLNIGARCLRGLARAVVTVAIGILLAPVGVAWNVTSMVVRAISCIRCGDHAKAQWIKIKENFASAVTDLGLFALTAFGVAIVALIILAPAGVIGFGTIVFGVITNFVPLFSCFSPEEMALILTYKKDRAGFYKAMILKHEFGIVSKQNKLLSWNPEQDKEEYVKLNSDGREFVHGHFLEIYNQQGFNFLFRIQEIQAKLQKKLAPPHSIEALTAEYIMGQLRAFNGRNNLAPEELAQIERDLKKCEANIARMKKIEQECIRLRESSFFGRDFHINLGSPFQNMAFVGFFFYAAAAGQANQPQVNSWDHTLNAAKPDLTEAVEGYSEVFLEIRGRLKENGVTPQKLFALEDGFTKEDLRRAYKRAMLFCHPDKNRGGIEKELNAVVNCIRKANEELVVRFN